MGGPTPRDTRIQFDSRVRLVVEDGHDLRDRYAANLSSGGMFVHDPQPLPVGSRVLIELLLPDDRVICRLVGKVIHSKPSLTTDDPTAGMGLRFIQMDEAGKKLARHFQRTQSATTERPALPPPRPVSPKSDGPVVGIDLGTINSCVAFVREDGRAKVITSDKGYETIPSVVHYDRAGPVSVGHAAQEKMLLDPYQAVYGSKRFLGRAFRSAEVQALGHFFNYALIEGPDGNAMAQMEGRNIPLESVSARVLAELTELASTALGQRVERAVVTVPAYFGESQRAATVAAGRRAGLKIERLINEPTAAAVAFGMVSQDLDRELTVLAYDLGGGTFDASLLRIRGAKLQVLASEGDPFLGGTDFDDRLIQFVLFGFEREHGVDLRADPIAIQRIRFAVEIAKRQLSSANEALVNVPFVATKDGFPLDINVTLTRDLFESLVQDLVDRSLQIVQTVLDRARVPQTELDDVILVGGQSRSPIVSRSLRERFGRAPSRRVHPDHAVAVGAAVIADRVYGAKPEPEPKPQPPSWEPSASASPAPEQAPRQVEPELSRQSPDEPMLELETPATAPLAAPLDVTEIVTASVHVVLPNGEMRTLFPRNTPLPAEREIFIPPTARSRTEYIVVLVRGEAKDAEQNEPVCALRVPEPMASELAGAKMRAYVRIEDDGQMQIIVEHPETGAALELPISSN